VALIAVVAVFALSVPLGRTPTGSTPPSSVVVGGSPLLDQPVPDLVLRDLDGATVRLADLRGRPLVINIWASWCVPCREEFPLLIGAYGEHSDDGLEILGIIRRDDPAAARAFAAQQGATWPLLLDPDDSAWRALLGVGVPQTYFVDPEGIVRWVNIGPFSAPGLAFGLGRILPATPSGGPLAS
jgi:cytochrome c biogenesis protein CcmG/thiol:disulfide interchange protein DsbE